MSYKVLLPQLVEDRDAIFKESDYVSLHVPATKGASTRSSIACTQAIDDYFSGLTPKFIVPELRDLV